MSPFRLPHPISSMVRAIALMALALGLALDGGTHSVASAAVLTVTTTADELNNDGDCSLREAIRAANLNVQVDACAGRGGTDTINLPGGTYILTLAGVDEDAATT